MVYVFVFFIPEHCIFFSPEKFKQDQIYATSFFAYAFGLTTAAVFSYIRSIYIFNSCMECKTLEKADEK